MAKNWYPSIALVTYIPTTPIMNTTMPNTPTKAKIRRFSIFLIKTKGNYITPATITMNHGLRQKLSVMLGSYETSTAIFVREDLIKMNSKMPEYVQSYIRQNYQERLWLSQRSGWRHWAKYNTKQLNNCYALINFCF